MEIERLPSGSYRIRQRYNGQRYSVTVDHKPSNKEALELLAEVMKDVVADKSSFTAAAEKYISLKANILSPRTVREYKLYPARLPDWFRRMPVSQITADQFSNASMSFRVRARLKRGARSTVLYPQCLNVHVLT